LSAELEGLRVGARRELLARDARREAQVVLDPGAQPGLAARRVELEHEDIESFGRAVDGGRESGRPGADDHDVPHLRGVDRRVETETVGELLVARIAEHRLTAADHDRHIGDGNPESVEEGLDVRFAIEVDEVVGIVVPRQEPP
jgi:hypothetical protein